MPEPAALASVPHPGPWAKHGACRNSNVDVFFPPRGGVPDQAFLICADCPVIVPCRRYALQHRALRGIWGGLSGADRRRIRGQFKEAS